MCQPLRCRLVRDIEIINGELRLSAPAWRIARDVNGSAPSTERIGKLLDERTGGGSPSGPLRWLSSSGRRFT
jgi:hypothetical protein